MRLFIAINLDRAAKRSIQMVQSRLKQHGQGNFSRAENLHLTLAFLGELGADKLPDIRAAMEETAVVPMTLSFDHTGCFGDLWWLGIGENPELAGLQAELSSRLRDRGFKLDRKKFTPHITLARQLRLGSEPDPRQLLGRPFSTQVSEIQLMESKRVDGRLIYETVNQVTSPLP